MEYEAMVMECEENETATMKAATKERLCFALTTPTTRTRTGSNSATLRLLNTLMLFCSKGLFFSDLQERSLEQLALQAGQHIYKLLALLSSSPTPF